MQDCDRANQALKSELAHREKLEVELRQAQKMEAIGRLAGDIAHDFNNILTGILGHAELARLEPGITGGIQQHLDGIFSAAQRARDLVQQILTFSRQRPRRQHPLKLHEALEDALKLLRASIPTSVTIRRHFDTAAPCIVADPTEIHKLATNLIINAWHAIGDHLGTVDVTTDTFIADESFAKAHSGIHPGSMCG